MGRRSAGIVWILLALPTCSAHAQQIHREGFEGPKPLLKLGLTDDPQAKLIEHELTTTGVHGEKQAERLLVQNKSGSFCFVEYACEKSLVHEELTLSAWVNASRPGTQILAHVILPGEIDPKTKQPVDLLLRGERSEVSGRWKKLTLSQPTALLEKQRQLLHAEMKRPIDIRGAYVDQVLFDIHGGLGETAIVLDDIQIGPIVRPAEPALDRSMAPNPLNLRDADGRKPPATMPQIRTQEQKNAASIVGETLRVGDEPFLLRAIAKTDPESPLPILRDLGCNAVLLDWPIAPALVQQAQALRLRLVPSLPTKKDNSRSFLSVGTNQLGADRDSTSLFFYVGGDLEKRHAAEIESVVDLIHERDAGLGRPVAGDVIEDVRGYSRRLDMVGVKRWPIMTSLDYADYRHWLTQRKFLARPGTHFWAWVQTHAPDEYCRAVFGDERPTRFAGPVGPTPEQIKLLAYATLSAGYRGIVYSSDRSISDYEHGRDRMLQLALLNLELMLIERFVAAGEPPVPARTSHPDISAYVVRHPRGVAILSFWKRPGAQFVVGQASANDVHVIVENAPESAQAFQITPSEVRGLRRSKDLGGIRIVIPEFDTAAIVVLSTDTSVFAHYQELVQQVARQAADWQCELAEIHLARTRAVHGQLELLGRNNQHVPAALHEAQQHLDRARSERDRGNSREAYGEAARCMRVARLAQRQWWEASVRGVGPAVSDPYAVSFYTLPDMHRFQAGIKQATFGANQLALGDFESEGNLDAAGWEFRSLAGDGLVGSAMLVGAGPAQGRRCLEISVVQASADPVAVVEHCRATMISPPVTVRAGQVARISGRIRLPRPVAGSIDGAMVWDTVGGEGLALRFTDTTAWQPFTAHRPIHRDGGLRVHLAMTGIGAVQFDDLQVQLSDNAVIPNATTIAQTNAGNR